MRVYACILLFCFLVPLKAQNTGNVMVEIRSTISPDVTLEPGQEAQTLLNEYNGMLSDAVVQGVKNIGLDVSLINTLDEDLSLNEIQAQATELNQNFLIFGYILIQSRRALIQLSFYDSVSGNILGSSQGFGRWNSISFFNTLYEQVDILVESLDRIKLAEIMENPEYLNENRPVRIILTPAMSDVELYINGDEYFATTGDSPLELPFHPYPRGQEIVLSMKKKGYYDQEAVLVLDNSLIEERLSPLIPATRNALIFRYNPYELYGATAGYRYYIREDEWYVCLADSFFITPALNNGKTAFHNDLQLETGFYPFFSKSTHRFRYGASFGVGVIFSNAGVESQWYSDVYVNWFTLFTELNLSKFSVALRLENRFNLGGDSSLLPRGNMQIKIPNEDNRDKPYTELPLLGLEFIWKL